MTFTAKLKKTSTIYIQWREKHVFSGVISFVRFHYGAAADYTTGPLDADEIDAMRRHNSITLEMVGTPAPPMPPLEVPPPDVIPYVELKRGRGRPRKVA